MISGPFVDRSGLLALVTDALTDGGVYAAETLPAIFWREDEGDFFERGGEMLGAYVMLSTSGRTMIGRDEQTYDVEGSGVFATKHSMLRQFRLQFSCESDAPDDQNTAEEILEHLRTRLSERDNFNRRLVALGYSVITSSDVTEVPGAWDGRAVNGAAFDLVLLAERTDVDAEQGTDTDFPKGGDYFDEAEPPTRKEEL